MKYYITIFEREVEVPAFVYYVNVFVYYAFLLIIFILVPLMIIGFLQVLSQI